MAELVLESGNFMRAIIAHHILRVTALETRRRQLRRNREQQLVPNTIYSHDRELRHYSRHLILFNVKNRTKLSIPIPGSTTPTPAHEQGTGT